jgi:glycine/D-amino acid oxidase-like deaminating enzyme
MKDRAEIVVVGAGIAGSSIAMHLARLGRRDVLVLEQGELVSGTTSHAPGLVGQLRASASLTRLLTDSVTLYRTLRFEGATGYQEIGSLRLASSPARMDELRRQHKFAQGCGLATELIGPREAADHFPLMSLAGVEGALFMPTDGSADAVVLANAMIYEAQSQGVSFSPHTRVTAIETSGGAIRAVVTNKGRVETQTLAIACGVWSPRVAGLAGVALPLLPMQHQYVAVGPIAELAGRSIANLRDPDNRVYIRQKGEDLIIGGYEDNPRPFAVDKIPDRANPTVQEFDRDHFAPLLRAAELRVPPLAGRETLREVNGIESFTPDGQFIVGPVAEVHGLWAACGFCAHGVSGGGGVGKSIAQWIVEGQPPHDLSAMNPMRFGSRAADPLFLQQRVCAVYSTYYDIAK